MEFDKKIKGFLKRPAELFILKIVLVYGGWKLLYYFFTHGNNAITDAWVHFIAYYGTFYAFITGKILNVIGEANTQYSIYIIFTATKRYMSIVEHCLAISATVVFFAAIFAFPGNGKKKLWFIPLGIFTIFCINLIRLVLLCITFEHYRLSIYNLYHTYIYVFITYGLIMLLIGAWVKITRPGKGKNIPVRTEV